MAIGSVLTFVVAYIYTKTHPEEPKEEIKKKKESWVKRGWRNAKRDFKKKFKKKKKQKIEGENTYRKKVENLHKTIEGLVE
jgi:hypothetical protein